MQKGIEEGQTERRKSNVGRKEGEGGRKDRERLKEKVRTMYLTLVITSLYNIFRPPNVP